MMQNEKAQKEGNKLIDWVFDLLTIFISIADITTDVIVLISFYFQDRITFFILSLIILIIAQIAYSISFIVRYQVADKFNFCATLLCFILLLPFGSLVSFLIYFTDNTDSCCAQTFHNITKLEVDENFAYFLKNKKHSKITKWIIKKLSKHIGFIIEACIESIPQALLQIVSIVYYKEANYISIISIFLSMFSVMMKGLVFSQGIDIKTYIWTWLCIIIDFYGIFFILSWVFYTNNTILQPISLGYFSLIGQIWFYKSLISGTPIVIIILLWWFVYYLPEIIGDICQAHNCKTPNDKCESFFAILFIIITGSLFVFIMAILGFIAIEIFCFTFIAFGIYYLSTLRWHKYTDESVSDAVNGIIDFISDKPMLNCCCDKQNDRMLRVLAVNYNMTDSMESWASKNYAIKKFIDFREESNGLNGLQSVTYDDIRNNCSKYNNKYANVLKFYMEEIKDACPDKYDWNDCICCSDWKRGHYTWWIETCAYIIGYYLAFIFIPIFVMCKILQICFPYIIVAYLLYNKHFMDIDIFQMVMLLSYIGLQIIFCIMGIMVTRIHWWLWHIQAGVSDIYMKQNNNLVALSKQWYLKRTWIPVIEQIILNLYGNDIGKIILYYYYAIDVSSAEV